MLAAAVSASQPGADSDHIWRSNETSLGVAAPNDPVEKELQKLMEQDDEAQAEADKWIRENDEFAAKGAGAPPVELKRRIKERFEVVRKGYEDFLQRHPNNTRGRVAYASFLGDLEGEDAAQAQLEKALSLDTNNPAVYNNLANIYGHHGPVKKAFEYYAKAIQINPQEPVYFHNFGTTVYLFRKDAKEYYGINENEVFAKAFELYSNAMRLDPQDFPLASDVAQTYYGIQPMRTDEALGAWTNALKIAPDEIEREGVYIHMARINTLAGRFAAAHAHLNAITNEKYTELKRRVARTLAERENPAPSTNSASSKVELKKEP